MQKIFLKNFRNIDEALIEFSASVNIFYGQNAQGKTNLIEALYLCATGRSMRTNIEQEMIKFGSSIASVKLAFFNGETICVNFENAKKNIFVNGTQITKLGELLGKLPIVIFSPEDLQLIKSNPSARRKFMDTEICQINKFYYYKLKQYYRILRQRNAFLKNNPTVEMFDIWDNQLIEHGLKIINEREKFIQKINEQAAKIYSHITNANETLRVIYKPNVTSEDFAAKIKKHRDYDIFNGSTSNGIHKDDLTFEINGKSAKIYGSQGQQKTVALTLKLAEINLIHEVTSKFPVLLLDDILSELDESRRHFLIDYVKEFQVVLTCNNLENLIKKNLTAAKFFRVQCGKFFNGE